MGIKPWTKTLYREINPIELEGDSLKHKLSPIILNIKPMSEETEEEEELYYDYDTS